MDSEKHTYIIFNQHEICFDQAFCGKIKPEWNIDGDNKNITPRYLYKNVYESSIQIH